ncbi:zinc metalloprotease HtpX [Acaryochloris sp. IP29b_bin.137]|uniref:zinc metalloprotease HtpX n=1 Tax=Acaryochloris sp. IP29b_bin.137 TaxID=2969217 RepID=UPI002639739F|nr:zinc metalloprotease HtpX [Acaryochloris sp. IP29b_bin.137]
MASLQEELKAGIAAQQQGQQTQAIQILERVWQAATPGSSIHVQAQMYLIMAHQSCGQLEQALMLCQPLASSPIAQVQEWATQVLPQLRQDQDKRIPAATAPAATAPADPPSPTPSKRTRAAMGMKLAMAGIGGNLSLASGVTVSLLFGMVLVLVMGVFLISESENPALGLGASVVLTLIINAGVFFLSPWLMDWTQRWLYGTHWITLGELEHLSPETSQILQSVCAEKKLKMPRLGIIEDQNPTAFTYGSLPNSARLVVSRGLFTYLDEDEVATVYAHELGHIVHWDFAVMTLASTLVQITYLIYTFAHRAGRRGGSSKGKDALQAAAIAAYVFYIIGTYLVLYLSRTREYFADHFAAEVTGNPNALSRALVKIAYGIVEEGQRSKEPSRLLEGTRALGIYDAKAATSSGTAYRVASDTSKIGRVFLWDLFNPWAFWMELQSTHPLTGKRVRALSTYAEQLGLDIEFDMGRVVGEGRHLNKQRLYSHFFLDLLLYGAEFIGLAGGLILGLAAGTNPITFMLIGLGLGILAKTFIMYPNFGQAPQRDVLTLMSDPYASPLRGQPVRLDGRLIGRGDAGYKFGSDLKLQDKSGMLFLRYSSRFGPIGNFLFGMSQVKDLIDTQVGSTGWFRRSIAPWMDLIQLRTEGGRVINSYHRFWSFIFGGFFIVLGLVFNFLLLPTWV